LYFDRALPISRCDLQSIFNKWWAALPGQDSNLDVNFTYELLRHLQRKLVPAHRGRSIFDVHLSLLMSSHYIACQGATRAPPQ
jgi:hypothetical protein